MGVVLTGTAGYTRGGSSVVRDARVLCMVAILGLSSALVFQQSVIS